MHLRFAMAFIAVLIVGAVTCGTAFAEEYYGPAWRINGNVVVENNAIKVKSATALKFEDVKLGASVECKVGEEGKVGSEGKGEITSVTANECKTVKACEAGSITVKAVHLPWKTQLEYEEIALRNLIAGGSGAPGWSIECKILGVKATDECTGEATVLGENVTGGVDMTYDSKTARLSCSVGGAESGVVSGTELDENPAGETLTVTGIEMRAKSIAGSPGVEGINTTECLFKAINQECEIEYINESTVEVEVTAKSLVGIEATTRYRYEAQGCYVGRSMLPGGKCVDRVWFRVAPGGEKWTNADRVNVQQYRVSSNTGFANGFLRT